LNTLIHDQYNFKEYVHRFGHVLEQDFHQAERDLQQLNEKQSIDELRTQVDSMRMQLNSLMDSYQEHYAEPIEQWNQFEGMNPGDYRPTIMDAKELQIRLNKDSRRLEEQLQSVN
jgi:exonuclease VII large subunit